MADAVEPALDVSAGAESLSLNGRIDILPTMPLPQYSVAGQTTYAARKTGDAKADYIAIICNTGLPSRGDQINQVKGIQNIGLLQLVDHGVIDWPQTGGRVPVFVYERPAGPRFFETLQSKREALNEETIIRNVLKPIAGALHELSRAGVHHGAIRIDNIFFRDHANSNAQLGDCLSLPAGFAQPAVFETIERAMTRPAARGSGLISDDLYALGVCVVMMALGRNPVDGLDDETLLLNKIDRGSFIALLGTTRLAQGLNELLRGLLTDDAKQRWTLADIDLWLSGRRLTPKQPEGSRRGARAYSFDKKDYWQTRLLARAFAQNVPDAARDIAAGELDKWLQRSLGDEGRANEVKAVLENIATSTSGKATNLEDKIVTRVCIALDPPAPLRYRGLSIMPMGIGPALADAFINNGNIQIIAEIISNQFSGAWINLQKEVVPDYLATVKILDQMRSQLDRTSAGSGPERVLYELNPSMPCISPMIRSQCATSIRDVLLALDKVASSSAHPREPIDRHIAAFCIVRERRLNESFLSALNAPEGTPRRALGILNILADLQYRSGPEKLKGLSAWMLTLLEPGIRRYRNKKVRERMQKDAEKLVRDGSLVELLRLVDDAEGIEQDRRGFLAARETYQSSVRHILRLENDIKNKIKVGKEIGHPISAIVSIVLALLLLGITLTVMFQH
jgi:eukaryotic-like serine/threonine-protein kinase